ncbi:MAG: D-arabinono-1,4-lactone oxidase [Coxiellaceae bacterium]|nr:D-arabinono-1,4-lactone oxidase [Coxiellaceae bacterium]
MARRKKLLYATNTDQVKKYIDYARKNKRLLRVIGSGHSVKQAIGIHSSPDCLNVMLSGDLRSIRLINEVEESNQKVAYVKVGAGCYIGRSPGDPLGTWHNSLNKWLDDHGYAIPIMGGLAHQSIAGFLLTGSSGGSVQHGLHDFIESIELIDGMGRHHIFTKNDEAFYGVAVSMGLMGVVVSVTIRAIPQFYVRGKEQNVALNQSWLSDDSRLHLAERFTQTEYMHLNWFSQPYINNVMQWSGQKSSKPSKVVAYHNVVGKWWMALLASMALLFSNWALSINKKSIISNKIVAALVGQFVTESVTEFNDLWWRALPADDYVPVKTLFKTDFTEVWLPLTTATDVINRLETMYKDSEVAGNFAMEIYATKQSPFWLSPAYGRDVIRIDPYWWSYNIGDPRRFFEFYWDEFLGDEGARLHWGKYLPHVGQRCGQVMFGPEFVRATYPKFDAWLALRQRLDPQKVFLTDYWQSIFDIE